MLGAHRHHLLLLPDHRARPRRRHRPGPRPARRRRRRCPSAPTSTRSSTCSRRRAALEMHERLASLQRGRFRPAELLAAATAAREPRLGGRRPDRGRRARRPGGRPAGPTRAPPGPTRPRSLLTRDRGRRRPSWSTAAGRRPRGRAPARATSAGCCRTRSPPLWEDRMTHHPGHRDRRARHLTTRSSGRARRRPRAAAPTPRVVVEDGRVAWVGPAARRPGRRPAASTSAGRAVDPRLRRLPRPPGVRRRPARRVRRPDGRRALRRRRHRAPRSPRRGPRPTTSCARLLARPGRRDARAGHDDRRDQERLRAHRRRRGARACASPARSPTRRPSSARTSCPPEYADRRDDYLELVTGPMLAACAPHARWVDVFCEPPARTRSPATRRGAVLAAGRDAGLGPAGARQPARPRPRRAARRRARGGQRRPLHLPRPTPTSTRCAAAGDHGRDAAARRGVLDPVALPGRRAPCSTPGSRSRWPPTATRAPATRRRCRSSSRWPSGRWA